MLSSGGHAALFGNDPKNHQGDDDDDGLNHEGTHGIDNVFVNDPCLDPVPPSTRRTVQSETEIAVLNSERSSGKKMVVGYNDSFGFFDNREGLSGFAHSTDGGQHWIDGGGLPPKVPAAGTGDPPVNFVAGVDRYFGDPVVVVHHETENFFFSSIYQDTDGFFTLGVNRGRFREAAPQGNESRSNTRCAGIPELNGIPDRPLDQEERIIWETAVVAVPPAFLGTPNNPATADFLDKEWLYVDQRTGTLYMTYKRFTESGETPIELVKCPGCAFKTAPLTTADWSPPSVIVPNEPFDFNQATMPITTPGGRLIVTWHMRRFATTEPFAEIAQAIEVAVSNDDGVTWSPQITVADVNPQPEPLGYNRNRRGILNAPFIAVDRGRGRRHRSAGREVARRLRERLHHVLQRRHDVSYADAHVAVPQGGTNPPEPVDQRRHEVAPEGAGERRTGRRRHTCFPACRSTSAATSSWPGTIGGWTRRTTH